MKIKIFLFHRVSPERDPMWDPIDPRLFEQIIRHLSKSYTPILLEDYFRNPQAYRKGNLCSVVFDDGYLDFIDYALPILKKYRVPASMYIVTSCVNSGLPPWTNLLDYSFYRSGRLKADFATDGFPEPIRNTNWSDDAGRIAYGRKLKPYLKSVSNSRRIEIFERIRESLNDVVFPKGLMMNWQEIAGIKAEGIEIGSHTVTHPLLARIESDTDALRELSESHAEITNRLGAPPYTISYPIGSYDERIKQLAVNAGYQLGLAVDQKVYNSARQDRFEVPRIELYNETFFRTKLRMNGIYALVKKLVR